MRQPRFTVLLKNGTEEWTVRLGNPRAGNAADCYPARKLIVLDKNRPRHVLQRDLLHEVAHVETPLDEDAICALERGQVRALAALRLFFSENPQK